jgi:hypothetical protein
MPNSEFTASEQPLLEICPHTHVDIRAFVCLNGAIQYVKQCLNCGEKIGNPIKHADVIAARGNLEFIARFDEELRAEYRAKMAASEMVARRAQREAQSFDIQRERLGSWYRDEYLNSEAWAEKRELVIQRAGGICEGCRSRKARIVHHLTYDHVGNELLFELVALCRSCHDRCHGIGQ